MTAQVEANEFMGSVLILQKGEGVFQASYGLADHEKKLANTEATRFKIGSISKAFTGALLHQLEKERILDLTQALGHYLKDLPAAWEKITLLHLLSHQSGIPDLEELPLYVERMAEPTVPRKTMEIFLEEPLRFPPGKGFEYSSSGFVVLAAVIEEVTGRNYEELLREKILDPLGLSEIGHETSEETLPPHAQGYRFGVKGMEKAPFIHMSLPIGGGELNATAAGLGAFAQALTSDRLFDAAERKALFIPQPINNPKTVTEYNTLSGLSLEKGGYSHGWFIGHQHGRACRSHGGVINGFSACLSHFPEEDLVIVVLSNLETYFKILETARDLAAIALGEFYTLPEKIEISLDKKALAAFPGVYPLHPGFKVSISLEGDQLCARFNEDPLQPIFPYSENAFFYKTSTYKISFADIREGKAQALFLHVGEGRKIKMKRKS